MPKPEIILATLPNGGVTVFVNTDASLALQATGKGSNLAIVAEHLARSLGIDLQSVVVTTPSSNPEWSWIRVHALAPRRPDTDTSTPIAEICDRLLDSEEHAVESAIPQVAEDAVEVLNNLVAKLGQLEEANQNLASHRDEAIELLGRLVEWAKLMGGWDAQCWRDASQYVTGEQPPVSVESDFGHTAAQLEAKYGNEHPSYSRLDWRHNVEVGGTQLGYWDWSLHQVESHYYDDCDECGEGKCDKVYVAGVGYICKRCAGNLEEPHRSA